MLTYSTDETLALLQHNLKPFFAELSRFNSTRALEASAFYAKLKPEIDKVLNSVAQEDFAPLATDISAEAYSPVRATAWNIERGIRLQDIIQVFKEHPVICDSGLLLLTELDYGMARTGNRFVAREIAEALQYNYIFAPCYLALNKGSGLEARASGENTLSLHGNALLSRFPLRRAHSIALPNGKDKMSGKEKRLGCQRAVVAEVSHPLGPFWAVSLHLDAHSSLGHRRRQMRLVLDHIDRLRPSLPVLIGGDWNTSTYNSQRAFTSILGFIRRVYIGVHHVTDYHYPFPDRWFERGLFGDLEKRGYNYRDLNEAGACTLHYDVTNLAANTNMGDWLPQWCFKYINWALKHQQGRCSLKLDWFAGRGISADKGFAPKVIGHLQDAEGVLSDHDAIVLDFVPRLPALSCESGGDT